MAGNLQKARKYFEMIKYYDHNAGAKGYQQAVFYFNKLNDLLQKTHRTKKYRSDVPLIHSIVIESQKMMDVMKKKDEYDRI